MLNIKKFTAFKLRDFGEYFQTMWKPEHFEQGI